MTDDDTDPIREAKLAAIDASHRCSPADSALIVVDMQHGFLDEGASLEVPAGRDLVPNIRKLLDVCREAGIPVVFTEFVYTSMVPCLRGDPFGIEHLPVRSGKLAGFGRPSSNCNIGRTPGEGVESASTVEQLGPLVGELVVRGHTYDKFYGTHLDLALRSQHVTRFMITGITTDVCVNSTLISGSTRNYRVTAISDAMAAVHERHHHACLEIWENKFARIKTTSEMIAELKNGK